jgi:hypothetical protein
VCPVLDDSPAMEARVYARARMRTGAKRPAQKSDMCKFLCFPALGGVSAMEEDGMSV